MGPDSDAVFCVEGEWFWVPLECEELNPEKLKGIGPFSSAEEALADAHENCWAPGTPPSITE